MTSVGIFMRAIIILLILTNAACSPQPENNGFDQVCSVFEQVAQEAKAFTDVRELGYQVREIVDTTMESDDPARQAWYAIANAPVGEQYELFQLAARSTLEQDWSCQIMADMLDK